MTSHAAGHLVYVETEADIDMPSKLKEIWDNAVTEGLDEDTVYFRTSRQRNYTRSRKEI